MQQVSNEWELTALAGTHRSVHGTLLWVQNRLFFAFHLLLHTLELVVAEVSRRLWPRLVNDCSHRQVLVPWPPHRHRAVQLISFRRTVRAIRRTSISSELRGTCLNDLQSNRDYEPSLDAAIALEAPHPACRQPSSDPVSTASRTHALRPSVSGSGSAENPGPEKCRAGI